MRRKIFKSMFCFIPTIIGIILWDRLPERIPIHYTPYGADDFSGKHFFVFGIPLLFFLIYLLLMVVLEKKPEWIVNKSRYNRILSMIPAISIIVFLISLLNA